jgi:hypothetical protein
MYICWFRYHMYLENNYLLYTRSFLNLTPKARLVLHSLNISERTLNECPEGNKLILSLYLAH